MANREVYIVAGYRSAVGKSGRGVFRFVRPDDLAADVVKHLMASVPQLDKESIDDVIVGNATPGGWNNPVPVPSQQLTRLNSVQYELELDMNANSNYILLPINGDWSQKYSVEDNTLPGLGNGGFFGFGRPQDFPSPAVDGLHKLELNFGIQDAISPANTAWFKTTKL